MGAEYKVHTKLLTEFETLGVMGENSSGIIFEIILKIVILIKDLPVCVKLNKSGRSLPLGSRVFLSLSSSKKA